MFGWAVILAAGCICIEARAANTAVNASPTAQTVMVDGEAVAFDAYNIEGSNYFKLRDVAFAVAGTAKQFDVTLDAERNAILLLAGTPYTVAGGELAAGDGQPQPAVNTLSRIFLDETELGLTAYNIGGSNYFMLRNIGSLFGFDMYLENDVIYIDTAQPYGYHDSGGAPAAPVAEIPPEPYAILPASGIFPFEFTANGHACAVTGYSVGATEAGNVTVTLYGQELGVKFRPETASYYLTVQCSFITGGQEYTYLQSGADDAGDYVIEFETHVWPEAIILSHPETESVLAAFWVE